MAPEPKKQKTDAEPAAAPAAVKETAAAVKPAAPQPPQETETDAAPIKGTKLADQLAFLPADTTLNALPSTCGKMLMGLSESTMQQFIAGARANVGVSQGRYFFEAKILESVGQPLLRVGFSTAGSALVLGSSAEGLGFESDGAVLADGKRTASGGAKFGRGTVVGVLLNLNAASENALTVSLFKDGKRVTQPLPLPKVLEGQTLYPHISYRGVTVHVNFGAGPMAALPFKCHMFQEAAQSHCTVTKSAASTKPEVVFPVGLPDEGTFDWLEGYRAKHPHFTELSDRMILDWAQASGLLQRGGARGSFDRPDLQSLDGASIRRAVYTVAPLQPRNYIVMEVRGNLLEDERKALLASFPEAAFNKVALVVVGEPTPEFKQRTHDELLKRKKVALEAAFRTRKVQEKHKKLSELKKKEADKAMKKRLREAKKKAKENRKKAFAERKAKAEKEGKAFKEEEKAESEDEDEPESDVEEAPGAESDAEEQPPKATLDAEEQKVMFVNHVVKDLVAATLSSSFAKFSLPKTEEGFSKVEFLWSKGEKCQQYMKQWISDKKLHLRVETLSPGPWSQKEARRWQTVLDTWQKKARDHKEKLSAKAKAKAARAAKKAQAEKAAALKATTPAAAQKKEEKKEDEAKEEEVKDELKVEEEEAEEEPVDLAKIDIFGAQDILDVGQGTPLFSDFGEADWAMLSLRFELHFLVQAFRKDVDDPDRAGILAVHIPFYYQKYFKRPLNVKDYGVDSPAALVKLVDDTVYLTEKSVLESLLPEDMESYAVFAKIVEDARRHRQLQADLGDEAARLKLNLRALQSHLPQQQQQGAKTKVWGTQASSGQWTAQKGTGKGKAKGVPAATGGAAAAAQSSQKGEQTGAKQEESGGAKKVITKPRTFMVQKPGAKAGVTVPRMAIQKPGVKPTVKAGVTAPGQQPGVKAVGPTSVGIVKKPQFEKKGATAQAGARPAGQMLRPGLGNFARAQAARVWAAGKGEAKGEAAKGMSKGKRQVFSAGKGKASTPGKDQAATAAATAGKGATVHTGGKSAGKGATVHTGGKSAGKFASKGGTSTGKMSAAGKGVAVKPTSVTVRPQPAKGATKGKAVARAAVSKWVTKDTGVIKATATKGAAKGTGVTRAAATKGAAKGTAVIRTAAAKGAAKGTGVTKAAVTKGTAKGTGVTKPAVTQGAAKGTGVTKPGVAHASATSTGITKPAVTKGYGKDKGAAKGSASGAASKDTSKGVAKGAAKGAATKGTTNKGTTNKGSTNKGTTNKGNAQTGYGAKGVAKGWGSGGMLWGKGKW